MTDLIPGRSLCEKFWNPGSLKRQVTVCWNRIHYGVRGNSKHLARAPQGLLASVSLTQVTRFLPGIMAVLL